MSEPRGDWDGLVFAGGLPEKIWRVYGSHSCRERFFYSEQMAGRALLQLDNEPARMDCYVPASELGKKDAEIERLKEMGSVRQRMRFSDKNAVLEARVEELEGALKYCAYVVIDERDWKNGIARARAALAEKAGE